jgi:Restriction endonuclease XhoI
MTMGLESRWEAQLREAVRYFWATREKQSSAQGVKSGQRDAGLRTAVTGGKQMNGFVELVRDFLEESGVQKPNVYCDRSVELPGWFRAEKKWDLLIVTDSCLIAAIEFKSQIGSFGNNFNNRSEEAIGSAADIWAAYREGAFAPSQRPWLGYFMMLEDADASTRPIGVCETHFKVFPEFKGASYARRYKILLTKLVRERHYDCASLLLSSISEGVNGAFREPSAELTFADLLRSLEARLATCIKK